jgi:SAM-dependent methyltransferase
VKRVAALVSSRNRPDLVERQVAELRRPGAHQLDVFVVECGTELSKVSPHATLWYPDAEFRGKCYGHGLLLEQARTQGRLHGAYDYYWVLMNDVFFEEQRDPLAVLVEQLEREPRLAILSPHNRDGGYPGAEQRPGGDWRPVTTCDYLGFLLRAEALEEVGFLSPEYAYCWGAIHELSYQLYSAGWIVGYSDRVGYRHLGGSTYGVRGTNTISREEYQRRAKRFAYDHLRARYGEEWPEVFWAATRGRAIEQDTYRLHREFWLSGFEPEEQAERRAAAQAARRRSGRGYTARQLPDPALSGTKLSLGAGRDRTPGWVHVDSNPDLEPDVLAAVESLPMYADGSVAAIQANHLFEHLTFPQARAALREWRRVLRPGGELFLELPDLERCLRLLGRHRDPQGYDLGTIGIFGYPPLVESEGATQIHKWGWTRATLAAELAAAGFEAVEFGPCTQDWRPAARVGRDLRVRAAVPRPAVSASPVTPRSEPAAALPRAAVRGGEGLLFAWPDWSSEAELVHLLMTFGPALSRSPRLRLAVYLDPADGDGRRAAALLERAYARALPPGTELEVELVQGPLRPEILAGVARLTEALVALPSLAGRPTDSFEGWEAPWVADLADLEAALGRPSPAAR